MGSSSAGGSSPRLPERGNVSWELVWQDLSRALRKGSHDNDRVDLSVGPAMGLAALAPTPTSALCEATLETEVRRSNVAWALLGNPYNGN